MGLGYRNKVGCDGVGLGWGYGVKSQSFFLDAASWDKEIDVESTYILFIHNLFIIRCFPLRSLEISRRTR